MSILCSSFSPCSPCSSSSAWFPCRGLSGWTRGARTLYQRFSRINSLEVTYNNCREFAEESLQIFCGMLYAKSRGLAVVVGIKGYKAVCVGLFLRRIKHVENETHGPLSTGIPGVPREFHGNKRIQFFTRQSFRKLPVVKMGN